VFCRLVVLVRLSVPEQVIDWKDSIVSEMTHNVLMETLNPTHSLIHSPEKFFYGQLLGVKANCVCVCHRPIWQ